MGHRTLLTASAVALLGFTACDVPPGQDVEESTSAIIHGAPLADADAARSGMIMLSHNGGPACSGTMLNASWVLTASHCVLPEDDSDGDGQVDPDRLAAYRIHLGNLVGGLPNPDSRAVDLIMRHPDGNFGFPATLDAVDATLMHVTAPVSLTGVPAGTYANGRMTLMGALNSTLLGKTLTCYGYGYSEGNFHDPSNLGILRWSRLPVDGTSSDNYSLDSGPDGEGNICLGDSGGSCFLDTFNTDGSLKTRQLTGVHTFANCAKDPNSTNNPRALDTPAETFRSWVDDVVYPTEQFRQEAEMTTTRTGAIRIFNDATAMGGQYIGAPAGTNSTGAPPSTGAATYKFVVPSPSNGPGVGTYYLWARAAAPGTNADSFWVRFNGGTWMTWNGIKGTAFHWEKVVNASNGSRVTLKMTTAGTYTLEVRYREGGAKLDRFFLTRDANLVPTGLEPPGFRTWIDALDFSVSDLVSGADPAAPYDNGAYYYLPSTSSSALDTPNLDDAGTGFFQVHRAGRYNVIGTVNAPAAGQASFWVRIDAGPWWKWTGIPIGGWRSQWVTDANDSNRVATMALGEGPHTLTVANRESGARFNRFTVLAASP